MPDSGDGQQDGAQTITPERFNGLMSAYQKEKARADSLANAQGSDNGQTTDSPEPLPDGIYEVVAGEPRPYTPTPRGVNGARGPKPQVDELAKLRGDIAGDRAAGPDNGWF